MKSTHIRAYRERAGMTQYETARKIGVSLPTFKRWESGKTEPTASALKKLCEVLGVTEVELLNGPAADVWELRVIYKKTLEGDVIDLTGNASNAEVLLGERAMSIKIDGPIDLWMDDAKFESLIADLRKKREAGMKARGEGW